MASDTPTPKPAPMNRAQRRAFIREHGDREDRKAYFGLTSRLNRA